MPVSSRAQRQGRHRVPKRLAHDTLYPGQSAPHPPRRAMTLKLPFHFRGPHGAAGTRPVSPRSEQRGTPNRKMRRHPGCQWTAKNQTARRRRNLFKAPPRPVTVWLSVVLRSVLREEGWAPPPRNPPMEPFLLLGDKSPL